MLSSGFSTQATPIGFAITGPRPKSNSASRAPNTINAAVAAPASQATGRQRGESSRPVGNSKGVKISARAMAGAHGHDPYQAARIAPGSDPGRVT